LLRTVPARRGGPKATAPGAPHREQVRLRLRDLRNGRGRQGRQRPSGFPGNLAGGDQGRGPTRATGPSPPTGASLPLLANPRPAAGETAADGRPGTGFSLDATPGVVGHESGPRNLDRRPPPAQPRPGPSPAGARAILVGVLALVLGLAAT